NQFAFQALALVRGFGFSGSDNLALAPQIAEQHAFAMLAQFDQRISALDRSAANTFVQRSDRHRDCRGVGHDRNVLENLLVERAELLDLLLLSLRKLGGRHLIASSCVDGLSNYHLHRSAAQSQNDPETIISPLCLSWRSTRRRTLARDRIRRSSPQ